MHLPGVFISTAAKTRRTPTNIHGDGAWRLSTPAPGPQRQGYFTLPPEALIAYHVPPNSFTPT
jgi:hypothetical protein